MGAKSRLLHGGTFPFSGKAPPNLPPGVPPLLPNPYIMAPGLLHAYPVSGTASFFQSCHAIRSLLALSTTSREECGIVEKLKPVTWVQQGCLGWDKFSPAVSCITVAKEIHVHGEVNI